MKQRYGSAEGRAVAQVWAVVGNQRVQVASQIQGFNGVAMLGALDEEGIGARGDARRRIKSFVKKAAKSTALKRLANLSVKVADGFTGGQASRVRDQVKRTAQRARAAARDARAEFNRLPAAVQDAVHSGALQNTVLHTIAPAVAPRAAAAAAAARTAVPVTNRTAPATVPVVDDGEGLDDADVDEDDAGLVYDEADLFGEAA